MITVLPQCVSNDPIMLPHPIPAEALRVGASRDHRRGETQPLDVVYLPAITRIGQKPKGVRVRNR